MGRKCVLSQDEIGRYFFKKNVTNGAISAEVYEIKNAFSVKNKRVAESEATWDSSVQDSIKQIC